MSHFGKIKGRWLSHLTWNLSRWWTLHIPPYWSRTSPSRGIYLSAHMLWRKYEGCAKGGANLPPTKLGRRPPWPLTVDKGISESPGPGLTYELRTCRGNTPSFWFQRVWRPHQPPISNLPQPAWGPFPWCSTCLTVGKKIEKNLPTTHPCPIHPSGHQCHDSYTFSIYFWTQVADILTFLYLCSWKINL